MKSFQRLYRGEKILLEEKSPPSLYKYIYRKRTVAARRIPEGIHRQLIPTGASQYSALSSVAGVGISSAIGTILMTRLISMITPGGPLTADVQCGTFRVTSM